MWKQPIPTNLEVIFGEDYRLIQLYKELIYRACNSDTNLTLDGKKFVKLKRGQVIFGRNKYAKYLDWSPKTVERTLKKLDQYTNNSQMFFGNDPKPSKLVTKQTTKNYTLVTVINYDSVVAFDQANDQAVAKQWPSSDQAVTTSKSDKSDKSDKKQISTVTLQENYCSSTAGSQKKKTEPIKGSSICVFIEKFNELFGKNYEVTDKRTKYLSQRLKRFPLEKILTSLDNLASSEFHRGKNDRNWVADPDFLIRSDEQIDKFLNLGTKKKLFNSNLPL